MDPVQAFRTAVEADDVERVLALLHDEVEFRSPVVHRAYRGREDVGALLRHAADTFEGFRYVDEVRGEGRGVLFFRAAVGDRELEGIDALTFDEAGRITELVVMIRPLSGLLAMAEAMRARLEADA